MKILITGCHGQVGYCLVQRLNKRRGVEVIAYDREDLDITNSEQVSTIVAQLKPVSLLMLQLILL